MEEVLSLLIINIAARRRPPFGMFSPLGKRQKCGLLTSVGFKKYEALLRRELFSRWQQKTVEDGTTEQLLMPLVI
jgi:hypothetical protein